MDFLNKAFAQIVDLFRSMTPGARITSALLVAVVVISLGFLIKQQSGGPNDYLLGGEMFSAADVTSIAGALGSANLEFEIEGGRIRIPRGQQGAYLGALADAEALPSDFATILQKSLDQGSFWMSKEQREASLKIATQKVLALGIRGMKGIENASVMYSIKTSRGLNRKTTATASVVVKPTGSRKLESVQVKGIRHMVAAAIAQLGSEQVTVTDQNGITYPASGDDSLDGGGNKYYELVHAEENRIREKLQIFLSQIPGIKLDVHVELDPTKLITMKSTDYDPKKGTPIRTREKTIEETTQQGNPAGRPGTGLNTSSNLSAELSGQIPKSSTLAQSDTEQITTPGGVMTQTEKVGFQPTRVKVSVLVPLSHYAKVWQEKNPDTEPTPAKLSEIEKTEKDIIQKIVVAQIPIPSATDPLKQVTVETYTDYINDEIPEPEMAENAMAWFGQHGGTLGMGFVGLFSLLMLRSMVRSTTPISSSAAPGPLSATNDLDNFDDDDDETDEATRQLKRRESGGPSLREELTDLVKEDPDAAANILQSWIGSPK